MGTNPKRAVERCEKLKALGTPPPATQLRKVRAWLRAYKAIMKFDITDTAEVYRAIYTPEALDEMVTRKFFPVFQGSGSGSKP